MWNKNFPLDELLGKQTFFAAENTTRQLVDMPLVVKTTDGGKMSNGELCCYGGCVAEVALLLWWLCCYGGCVAMVVL